MMRLRVGTIYSHNEDEKRRRGWRWHPLAENEVHERSEKELSAKGRGR
jgi:hypothetical protein